mmetsp:Transcript_19540/g.24631  ORF Transcript_19540/g.24631 Transcript_19540/m.24631 type:complete len:289 (+) Transcript_19540:91-957(+)|eukprot:CAMPEP_0203642700 /NCGR_PEP_ID=MMETSP0088-20131115/8094_1 /ASSEMBLY_ACC=CAM_ASM_001087 /TAXON_ID=426623 /ORGANISM="Chaetoceros affinis, Strain CCMP159" /LENGTH=288 /DNA_ID=CAMNT_0050498613 /DNA_START=1 /DNA_END=867 /DNA_ORIENTATION=+
MRFFSILALLSVSFVAATDSTRPLPEDEPIDVVALEAEKAEIAAQELREANSKEDSLLALLQTKEREVAEIKSELEAQVDSKHEPSLGVCTNDVDFKDKFGLDCNFYNQFKSYCDDAYQYVNKDGESAKNACCACGGGDSGYGKGVYYMKSMNTGEYVGIYKLTSPHVRMSDNLWSPYIKIEIVPLVNNEYALMSHRYGDRFISIKEDGSVRSYHVVGDWERFKIIESSNGSVQFYNIKWSRYLDVYNGLKTREKPLGKYTAFNLVAAPSMDTEVEATKSMKRTNLRA